MCPPYACRPAGLGGFFGQRVHGWLSHAVPLGLIFGNIATAVPRMGIPVMLFLGQEPCPRNVKKNDSESRGTSTTCLLYTSPSPRDATLSRMPSSA